MAGINSIKRFVILLAMLWPFTAFPQTISTDDGIKHWETDFRIGLNTDGYQFDFGIGYFPLQFIGIKMQLGFAGEIEELEDWGKDEFETHHPYATRFRFTSSLVLRTPRLLHWKSQDAAFSIFAEPGIMLSPGARGSRHAEFFNWDVKIGVNMQIDRFIFTIGYGISNFSLYSGYPENHWGNPSEDKYLTHSVFIGGAYKF